MNSSLAVEPVRFSTPANTTEVAPTLTEPAFAPLRVQRVETAGPVIVSTNVPPTIDGMPA